MIPNIPGSGNHLEDQRDAQLIEEAKKVCPYCGCWPCACNEGGNQQCLSLI